MVPFAAPSEPEPTGTPPEFIITVKTCQVKEGETAEFTCQVTGEPTPDLTWYYNNQELEGTGRYTMVQRDQLQVLEVYDVVPVDGGEYQVTAKNPFGQATCGASLEVIGNCPGLEVNVLVLGGKLVCYC